MVFGFLLAVTSVKIAEEITIKILAKSDFAEEKKARVIDLGNKLFSYSIRAVAQWSTVSWVPSAFVFLGDDFDSQLSRKSRTAWNNAFNLLIFPLFGFINTVWASIITRLGWDCSTVLQINWQWTWLTTQSVVENATVVIELSSRVRYRWANW